jgi:hypothetical protein
MYIPLKVGMLEAILQTFDPKNSEHVMWLKKLGQVAKSMERSGLSELCEKNPWKVKLKQLDVPEVHFCLCVKYVEAVFNHTAFVPE